ncbi:MULTISPECIES: IS1 family transposase [Pectobacterium]
MASVTVHCPRCQSAQVYRHRQNPKSRGSVLALHLRSTHR